MVPEEQYFYDRRGNLIESRDAAGARTLFWYDKLNRVSHKLSSLGTLTRYFYDKNSNLLRTRVYAEPLTLPADAQGSPPSGGSGAYRDTIYTYDGLNQVKTVTTPNVTSATYATSLTVATANATTSYDYDAMGNVVRTTDANGAKTWSYYDNLGRKKTQIDAANYRTDWSYDSNGNVLAETRYATASATPTSLTDPPPPPNQDAVNDRVTNFSYDNMGRRLTETRASVLVHNGSGGHSSQNAVITYTYNGLGQVASKTEASGDIIAYDYDLGGRMKSEQRYREMGAADYSFTDFNGVNVTPTIEYAYNGLDNLTQTKALGAGGVADRITSYTYGAGGLLASVTDAAGFKRAYFYDIAGRVRREEYNRLDFNAAASEAIGYDYDIGGRVTRQGVMLKVGANWSRDGAQIDTIAMTYNAFGEVSQRGFAHYVSGAEQPLMLGEKFEYDAAGRLVRANAGDGAWKYFMYDAAGNQTLAIATAGADFADAALDTLDEVLALWSDGVSTIATTNVAGVTATITKYDARNMGVEVIEPQRQRNATTFDNLITTRAYNAFGEIATEINAAGARIDYSYNTMGRRIKTESPAVEARAENGNWITGYHSTTGALLATSGTAVTFRPIEHRYYDISGRLVASRDANTNLTRLTLLAGTGYGGSEAAIAETIAADDGVTRTRYDVHGDARRIEDPLYNAGQSTTAHAIVQSFDAMGRLVSMNRSNVLTDYYGYDGLGQRTKHWNSFYNANGAATYEVEQTAYDAQGRITQIIAAGGDTTAYAYAWDATLVTAGMNANPFGGWVKTTTFANAMSLTEKSDVFGREVGRINLSNITTNFTYDRAGRLTQKSATQIVNGNTVAAGEALNQNYYNTGRLASIWQTSGSQLRLGVASANATETFSYRGSSFGYDKVGNVTAQVLSEQGSWTIAAYWQGGEYYPAETIYFNRTISNQSASFDALGRIVSWSETGNAPYGGPSVTDGIAEREQYGDNYGAASHVFTYDAAGNIRRSLATYRALDANGAIAATDTTQDYWYRYDAMNRMATAKGSFSGAIGSGSIVRGTTGVDTTYNLDGTRAFALDNKAGNRREDYVYDGLGRVIQVKNGTNLSAPGAVVGAFTYDALSRLLTQNDYDTCPFRKLIFRGCGDSADAVRRVLVRR
ncbi:MAG: hypothetical protein ACT4OF_03100 [Caulobacteraceae bacterium]